MESQIFWNEIENLRKNHKGTFRITWLNHYSITRIPFFTLGHFQTLLIDGTLLQIALKLKSHKFSRTSADLVLPAFFSNQVNTRYLVIGGAEGESNLLMQSYNLQGIGMNGYDELKKLDFKEIQELILREAITVVIIGLGPGLQEQVSLQMPEVDGLLVITCGGWIGQSASKKNYFGVYWHRFRLGWLLRILHEPRRLLRRYTLGALYFVLNSRTLLSCLESHSNFEFEFGFITMKELP